MATMTPDKIQKISERMVEMERANNSLGRSNTQTTNQLMTLTMLTDSPYRRLRQCLAQIERKKEALKSRTRNKRMGTGRYRTFSYKHCRSTS